jgi:hypothetical protein
VKAKAGRLLAMLLAVAVLAVTAPSAPVRAEEPNEQAVLSELFTLNRSLEEARAEITKLDGQMQENARQQDQARTERDRLAVQRRQRQNFFERRVRYIYEHGSFGSFAVLLGADSLSDFLERLDMVTFILRRDADVMHELRQLTTAVEEQGRALAQRQAELAELQANQRSREQELTAAIGQKEAILAGLQDQRAAVEQRLDNLEQVWTTTAEPVLASLGTSLKGVDMAEFQADSTQVTLFPPGAAVRISQETLNGFFGKKADLRGLLFRIAPGDVSMEGDYTGTALRIHGIFTVQGKTVLRYEPKEIKVGDFTVPEKITDAILAAGTLDIDMSRIVSPWSLKGVSAEAGYLLFRAGL